MRDGHWGVCHAHRPRGGSYKIFTPCRGIGITHEAGACMCAQGKSLLDSVIGELRGPTEPRRALRDCG